MFSRPRPGSHLVGLSPLFLPVVIGGRTVLIPHPWKWIRVSPSATFGQNYNDPSDPAGVGGISSFLLVGERNARAGSFGAVLWRTGRPILTPLFTVGGESHFSRNRGIHGY